MTEAPNIRTSRMSYEEALTVLGLSGHPSQETIKKKYRKLALKYHPDLATIEQKEAMMEKFKIINMAHKILQTSPPITKVAIKEQYERLKKIIPAGSTDQRIDIIVAKEINKYRNKSPAIYDEMQTKLEQARDLYKEEKYRTLRRQQYIPLRAQGIARARTVEAVKWGTPELREILDEQKAMRREALQRQNAMLLERAKRIIHGTPRVPVIAEHPTKKKIIIRWIILTASLAAAILTGKYLFNRYHKAFRNKKIAGYLPAPR